MQRSCTILYALMCSVPAFIFEIKTELYISVFFFFYFSSNMAVIFIDNSGGCDVNRILKSKNDSDCTSAKLHFEVGDRLAVINGIIAMKKSVSQVCAMKNSSLDPKRFLSCF